MPEEGNLSVLGGSALPAQRVTPEVLFQRLSEVKGAIRHPGRGRYLVFALDSFMTLGDGIAPL